MSDTTTTSSFTSTEIRGGQERLLGIVNTAIAKRSFCTLATVSRANRPHVAGVLYEPVDTTLYVNTFRSSRKARNIADNPHVAVCIPVRRLPVGPPSELHFQATAEILELDHPDIKELLDKNLLKSITGHGELEEPDGCFLRITPEAKINTFGLGMPLRQVIRDPFQCLGSVELPA